MFALQRSEMMLQPPPPPSQPELSAYTEIDGSFPPANFALFPQLAPPMAPPLMELDAHDDPTPMDRSLSPSNTAR
jgi:hypothetical protein